MATLSTSMQVWALLAQIHTKIGARATDQILPAGFSPAQAGLLRHVIDHPGHTQVALATDLSVTKGNVSMLLEKLRQGGYISRRRIGSANLIEPTEAGVSLMADLSPRFARLVEEAMSGLTAQQRRRLLALLLTLRRTLDSSATTVAGRCPSLLTDAAAE